MEKLWLKIETLDNKIINFRNKNLFNLSEIDDCMNIKSIYIMKNMDGNKSINEIARIDSSDNKFFTKLMISELIHSLDNVYNNLKQQYCHEITNPTAGQTNDLFSTYFEQRVFNNKENGEIIYYTNKKINENNKEISKIVRSSVNYLDLYEVNKNNENVKLELTKDPILFSLPILQFVDKQNKKVNIPPIENLEISKEDYLQKYKITEEQLSLLGDNFLRMEDCDIDDLAFEEEKWVIENNNKINDHRKTIEDLNSALFLNFDDDCLKKITKILIKSIENYLDLGIEKDKLEIIKAQKSLSKCLSSLEKKDTNSELKNFSKQKIINELSLLSNNFILSKYDYGILTLKNKELEKIFNKEMNTQKDKMIKNILKKQKNLNFQER